MYIDYENIFILSYQEGGCSNETSEGLQDDGDSTTEDTEGANLSKLQYCEEERLLPMK